MVEAAGSAGLLVEARLVLFGAVALQRHVDRLDRYGALERGVGRLVNDAHRAATELGLDRVAAELACLHVGGPRRGLAAGLDRSEDPPPHGVVRLLRCEVEAGIDGERLLELLAALALAAGDAIDERRVLVGIDALALGQALLDRALQGLQRLFVLAVLVLLEAGTQGLLGFRRLEQLLHLAHGLGLAAGERRDEEHHQRSGHFWNLCLILMASPAFTLTFST